MMALLDFLQAYNGAVTAIATILLAVFTGVLSYFTIRLARATILAANAAKTSADAIVDNERPWVGIVTVTVQQPNPNLALAGLVTIQNTGHTPARQMRAAFRGSLTAASAPGGHAPDINLAPQKALFPNVPDFYYPFHGHPPLSQSDFEAICNGKKILWVAGRIEYLDNRGTVRWTNSQSRWDQSRGAAVPHETGNDAS